MKLATIMVGDEMMFRIGEFSKLTQVSIRMLRYYDEVGLLTPAKVDKWTGHRLYSVEQIPVCAEPYGWCAMTSLMGASDSHRAAKQAWRLAGDDARTGSKILAH